MQKQRSRHDFDAYPHGQKRQSLVTSKHMNLQPTSGSSATPGHMILNPPVGSRTKRGSPARLRPSSFPGAFFSGATLPPTSFLHRQVPSSDGSVSERTGSAETFED